MSADPIIYCLEHLTDYRQFERLCTDLFSQTGYPDIEPLGGSSDGGRDALHVSRSIPAEITIFAYSVRSDWVTKLLREDCKRIKEEGHELNRLVFACTSGITAGQRDEAIAAVKESYGWQLELFSIERIRTRLTGELRHLVAQHPSIFTPPFFPTVAGLSIVESFDTLVIDHLAADHSLATWLARRLQLSGFRVWCMGTAPLAGENPDESIRRLINCRAKRYLPIVSRASALDIDFLGRCSIAADRSGLTIPCVASDVDNSRLPSKLRASAFVNFSSGWKAGLASLLSSLEASGVKPSIGGQQGTEIALRTYSPEPVTKIEPERVYANTFPTIVPEAILVCDLTKELSEAELIELRTEWAFVVANNRTLLSFEPPPSKVPVVRSKRLPGYAWKHYPMRYEKRSVDVAKELVRRSLDLACIRAGLKWCDDRKKFYFVAGEKKLIPYMHVDGRKTRTSLTGQVTYGSGEYAKPINYQLCPVFSVGRDETGDWWSTMRIYVRVTDASGKPFEKKAIIRRRKKVTKSWWNQEWFSRTIAVMQTLETEQGKIAVGCSNHEVSISTTPLCWECPVAIDYEAVERIGDFFGEFAELRDQDGEFDDESLRVEEQEDASDE